jgi:hypothetical protein
MAALLVSVLGASAGVSSAQHGEITVNGVAAGPAPRPSTTHLSGIRVGWMGSSAIG